MKMLAVIDPAGNVINLGDWQLQPVQDGPVNPLPSGAVQGEFDIVLSASGRYVLASNYRQLREAEYPPIGDQLDALFKAGVFPPDMQAQIVAVKAKYPKPTQSPSDDPAP